MSPEVWTDVRPRIQAVVTALGIGLVEWPNEQIYPSEDQPSNPQTWLSIDISAESSERIELGRDTWEEQGTIWLHLMLPTGTGIDAGLAMRKQFSVAFRNIDATVSGLYYREQAFDPLGVDDGIFRRLSLLVRYSFTDILT